MFDSHQSIEKPNLPTIETCLNPPIEFSTGTGVPLLLDHKYGSTYRAHTFFQLSPPDEERSFASLIRERPTMNKYLTCTWERNFFVSVTPASPVDGLLATAEGRTAKAPFLTWRKTKDFFFPGDGNLTCISLTADQQPDEGQRIRLASTPSNEEIYKLRYSNRLESRMELLSR